MEFIKAYLAKRKNENTLRTLLALDTRGPGVIVRQGQKYVDFSSNDYLGFPNIRNLLMLPDRLWMFMALAPALQDF